jgi:hypothetical protein
VDVGEVAAPAARDADLFARLWRVLDQHSTATALPRDRGAHHAGRAGAYDDDVEVQFRKKASVDEISEVVSRLESLGLPEIAQIARHAIDVAFPGGLAMTNEEKSQLTEWTAQQEELLGGLTEEFEEFNGRIINVLAEFYRRSQGAT